LPSKKQQEEVGDLFVTEASITVKLLPSKKSASKPIAWFENGVVTNYNAAAKDISSLVERLQGKSRVVRSLTLMTDRGLDYDLTETGLHEAVSKAGFTPLN
jgi:hypothetical protein